MAELFDSIQPDGSRQSGIFRAVTPRHATRPGPPPPPPAHDCYTDARCCEYCETHLGCRCDGEW